MATLYSNDFDAEALGTLPSGWTNAVGSFTVGTRNAVSGRALQPASPGDIVVYTGAGSLPDVNITGRFRAVASPDTRLDVFVRCDASAQNGYRINYGTDGQNLQIYKRVSGAYTTLSGPSNFAMTTTPGDVVVVEVIASGSTIEARVWNATTGSRPSSASMSVTDTTFTTGNVGFCSPGGVVDDLASIDNVAVTDNGVTPAGVFIGRLNAAVTPSPYNFRDDGASLNTNCTGAYLTIQFTGTALTLNTVALTSGLNGYPVVKTYVDDRPASYASIGAGATATVLASGLPSGTHVAKVMLTSLNQLDNYWNLVSALKVTGFTLDTGATAVAVPKRSKTMILYGDSIPQGYGAPGAAVDASLTYVPALAKAFAAEVGAVCYGGQGYTQANVTSGVPALSSAYGLYSAGVSRLSGGLLPTPPDYLVDAHGTNPTTGSVPTQSDIATQISNWRAIAPDALILMVVPMGGYARAAKTAATNAAKAAGDNKIFLIDAGAEYDAGLNVVGTQTERAVDGLHPYARTHAEFAAKWASLIQRAIEPRRFTVVAS